MFGPLIAPSDPTAINLFKWSNKFSWSYNGEVADSIKERVKKAGGKVEGDLCCRLAWFNYDDLDLHMIEPDRNEIYYSNKGISRCGGMLDVDMNAGHGHTRTPVENIFYSSRAKMKEGIYRLFVHNYRKREMANIGFVAEIDILGTVYQFSYTQNIADRAVVQVANIEYTVKNGFRIIKSLPHSQIVGTAWGLQTNNFHQVSAITLSPNYWGPRGAGNKHFFFLLKNCINDGTARGFYNEFLKEELNAHRKVFEVVGSKLKFSSAEADQDQLSGLGFSSTQRNSLVCRVKGSFARILKINF